MPTPFLLYAAALFALPKSAFIPRPVATQTTIYQADVASGVRFIQKILPPPKGPLVINALIVNPKAPGVRIETTLAQDVLLADDPTKGRETVGSMAARHNAVGAINGDFFPYTGVPVGLVIRNGELVRDSLPNRVVWGLTSDGRSVFGIVQCYGLVQATDGAQYRISGLNRPLGDHELVLLTPVFGARSRVPSTAVTVPISGVSPPLAPGREVHALVGACTAGDPNAAIPTGGAILAGSGTAGDWLRQHVHPGDPLALRFDLQTAPETNLERALRPERANSSEAQSRQSIWNEVVQAVSGGPWLVHNGSTKIDGAEEGFNLKSFVDTRHPRTALGVCGDGEILLVTVDGRQPQSRGVTLKELAEVMTQLGAVEAINLDGGGSTTMWISGGYVNAPSDGAPRAVADALLVYANPTGQAGPSLTGTADPSQQGPPNPPPISLQAGESVPIPAPSTVSAPGTVWSTLEGTAFVDQAGTLTAIHSGSGTAVASHSGAMLRIPFVVRPGPPAALHVSLGPAPNNPPDRSRLHISVVDRYGNGTPDVRVTVTVRSGTPDASQVLTGPNGRADVEIVWDAAQGAVQVTAGALSAHLQR